jgi:hypothetical protein
MGDGCGSSDCSCENRGQDLIASLRSGLLPGIPVTSPAPRSAWREIVAAHGDSLPEHVPQWVDATCATDGYADVSRLYEFPDGRRFLLPLFRERGLAGVGGWLTSFPPGWGIGGLSRVGLDRQ